MARESITKVPNQTAAKWLIVFLLLSSDGLAQYCVNLSRWFTHETAAFSTEQYITPSLFHNFEVSQGACSHSLKHYGFQFGILTKVGLAFCVGASQCLYDRVKAHFYVVQMNCED